MSLTVADKLCAVLYPLVDALGMRMRLHPSTLTVEGAETIELPAVFPGCDEMTMTILVKVMAYHLTVSYAAVLVKVSKRLWLLATHAEESGAVTVQVLDAAALDLHESTFMDRRLGKPVDYPARFGRGVKATFEKPVNATARSPWIRMNDGIENDYDHFVDGGQEVESGKGSRSTAEKIPSPE